MSKLELETVGPYWIIKVEDKQLDWLQLHHFSLIEQGHDWEI